MTYNEFREMRGIPIPTEEAAAETSVTDKTAHQDTQMSSGILPGEEALSGAVPDTLAESKRKGK